MLKFYTAITKFLFAFIILPGFCQAQEIGSAPERTGPSICECKKYAPKDKLLREQCDQRYDYNLMSNWERNNFNEKLEACKDPEICDCAERSSRDSVLANVCAVKFDTSAMDSSALQAYQTEKNECYIAPKKPSLKRLCDCVHGNDVSEEDCRDIWDVSNLSKSDRLQFVDEITGCIEHADDPNFTLTVCDCIDAPQDDYILQERCANKFDLTILSAEEVQELRQKAKDCGHTGSNVIDLICDCIKEERTTGRISPKCQKLLVEVEQKYLNKSLSEREAFIQKLMDCIMQ